MDRRNVVTYFWLDDRVRNLPAAERYLFLYLISNPHSHISGIYQLTLKTIAYETGLAPKRIPGMIRSLVESNRIEFDAEANIVFVRNMIRYQASGIRDFRAAAKHVKRLPTNRLTEQFLSLYPEIKTALNEQAPTEKSTRWDYPEDFSRWWKLYPWKTKKRRALVAWRKLSPDSQLVERMMLAITEQILSSHFIGSNHKDYTPHPATWLNDARWEDLPRWIFRDVDRQGKVIRVRNLRPETPDEWAAHREWVRISMDCILNGEETPMNPLNRSR